MLTVSFDRLLAFLAQYRCKYAAEFVCVTFRGLFISDVTMQDAFVKKFILHILGYERGSSYFKSVADLTLSLRAWLCRQLCHVGLVVTDRCCRISQTHLACQTVVFRITLDCSGT